MPPDRGTVPEDLDASMSLDDVARHRPMARALLLADLLAERRVPIDVADRLSKVGEVAELKEAGPEEGSSPPQFSRWPLRSPRATLRPIAPCDFGSIHSALNDPGSSRRLPIRGNTVLPPIAERLIEGNDLQMVGAANRHPTVPVALMALHGYDPVHRVADLSLIGLERDSVARATHRPHRGLRFETAAMFVGHAFASFNLERITASVAEFNWHYFSDGEDVVFRREGVRRSVLLSGGRRWDVHDIAIHHDDWREVEKWLVPSIERFVPDD